VVLITVILVVGLLMYYRRMPEKDAKKQVELDDSFTKAGDVKAKDLDGEWVSVKFN